MTVPDAEAVYQTALVADPSLDPAAGRQLAEVCLSELEQDPGLDAPEVARRCLATTHADASWVAHVARAAVDVTSR